MEACPPTIQGTIKTHFEALSTDSEHTSFAVRSSSNLEDALFHSMAGMFESYI